MQKSRAPSGSPPAPPAGRGRPRAFDREAALSEATRLFWAKGYEATSITDLTEAMGIGAPSLYAAFGSKEALYAEALGHYSKTYSGLVWTNFQTAGTTRDAVLALLVDSASSLTGCRGDMPNGCMVTLSSVGSEGHAALGDLVKTARSQSLELLEARFAKAVADGEIPAGTDLHALARFVQTVQSGMSILARDGASRKELESVAEVAIMAWDARTGSDRRA